MMLRLYYIGLEVLQSAVVFLPAIWLVLYFGFHRRLHYIFWESIFGLYVLSVLAAVGFPSLSYLTVDFTVNVIPFGELFDFSMSYLSNMILNVILFVPLGVFLPMMSGKWKSWKYAVLTGFLFSLFIEIIQIFSFRATDVDDLMMNTLGAAAGYGIWYFIRCNKFFKDKAHFECSKWELGMIFLAALVVKFFVS